MFKKFVCGAALGALLFTGMPAADAAIAYLAPAGTFSEEAARIYFGNEEDYIATKTVELAVEQVMKGESEFAVIPEENTIGGLTSKDKVNMYLDQIIKNPELSIVGEVNLPIRQTLMAYPGTKLEDIKTIYSHPQGIKQGKDWLAKHCPNAVCEEVSSTAEGARRVSELKDPSYAAIAGPAAAPLYGLDVLGTNIQVIKTNITRFYVITKKAPVVEQNDRAAILATGNAAELPALLNALTKQGCKLISVHSRSAKTMLGDYNFAIEVEGGKLVQLNTLQKKFDGKLAIRILGTFNEITPQD